MPRYHVCVTAEATQSQVMTIVAKNAAEARALALATYEVDNFELDDNFPQDVYVSWDERIKEIDIVCNTRADLFERRAWRKLDLDTDSSGNPCVWRNYYVDEDGRSWSSDWSCRCDDDDFTPYDSEWLGPEDQAEVALWEMLPEAQ